MGGSSSEYRNYYSSSHSVTAHYAQTLAWQHEGGEEEVWRGSGGSAAIMTTFYFHTCHLFSPYHTLWPQPVSHSLICPFTWSLTSFCPLSSFLCLLSLSVMAGLKSFQGESALICSPSGFVVSLWLRGQHGPPGMSQNY